MALISMAIFSTEENGKDEYLEKTLQSLKDTVDFTKHRLILSVNGYTQRTKKAFEYFANIIHLILWNDENIGTAEAINKAWYFRKPGENAVKMDDDVVIHSTDWLYLMEETIRRDPSIGQVGLKRRDCMEFPGHDNSFYRSKLFMLPHKPGEKWITVEQVSHVMGTCVMHSSALLDKVGYLWQPGQYGFDDSFMSLRSHLAGFINVFLTAVDIEHIDRGDTPFQKWKEDHSSSYWGEYHEAAADFKSGNRPLYYDPFEDSNKEYYKVLEGYNGKS